MIALGTGIAPMRALVQERMAQHRDGEEVGPLSMLFGSKFKKLDYLYEEEMIDWEKKGYLTHRFEAFSRDQAHKIYV